MVHEYVNEALENGRKILKNRIAARGKGKKTDSYTQHLEERHDQLIRTQDTGEMTEEAKLAITHEIGERVKQGDQKRVAVLTAFLNSIKK